MGLNWNYLKFGLFLNFSRPKWVFAFICFCFYPLYSIYQMNDIDVIQQDIFSLLCFQFGLYNNIFLLFLPIYLFLISDIMKDSGLENFVLVRFSNSRSWFNTKIIILLILTVVYLSMAFLICIFIGLLTLPSNTLSGVNFNDFLLNGNMVFINAEIYKFSPLLYVIILYILLVLSFFTLGLLINFISLYFQKSIIPFCLGIIFNFSLLVLLKLDLFGDFFLIPYKKMLMQYQEFSFNILNINSIAFSIFYWFILILVLWRFALNKLKNINFIYEVSENE